MNNKEIIANIASNWWTKVIVNPKMDNGDKSEAGLFSNMLAKLATTDINKENLIKFKDKLKELIITNIDESDKLYLVVDYSPSGLLFKAAKYANISTNNFPIKTTMIISSDCIKVRYGYSASIEILYATENYYVKQLNNAKKTLEHYHNRPANKFYSFNKEDIIEEQKECVKKAQAELDTFNEWYKEKGAYINEQYCNESC